MTMPARARPRPQGVLTITPRTRFPETHAPETKLSYQIVPPARRISRRSHSALCSLFQALRLNER
jgi:hypothetical protein